MIFRVLVRDHKCDAIIKKATLVFHLVIEKIIHLLQLVGWNLLKGLSAMQATHVVQLISCRNWRYLARFLISYMSPYGNYFNMHENMNKNHILPSDKMTGLIALPHSLPTPCPPHHDDFISRAKHLLFLNS